MLPKRDKDKWRLSGKRQKPYGGLGNPQKENKETERNKNTVNVMENENTDTIGHATRKKCQKTVTIGWYLILEQDSV